MSQTTFIESVRSWTKEECQENIYSALPKLISYLTEDSKHNEEAVELILSNFGTVCDAQKIEEIIFDRLSGKLCSTYDHLLQEIISIIQQASDQVHVIQKQIITRLQRAAAIVEGMDLCSQNILSQCTQHKLQMSCLHSFLPTTLHIIKSSYTHCKDSSEVYGQYLGLLSEQLSTLFKKAHSLQMVLVSLLDKIDLTSEEDLQDMAQVISGLHAIGQLSTNLDVKITVTLWKVVSRLSSQFKELLHEHMDYNPIIQSLCSEMLVLYEYITQRLPKGQDVASADDKSLIKQLKILGFEMKILIKFLEEFGADLSRECVKDLHKFLLSVFRYIPPSSFLEEVPQSYIDEIQKQFTNGTEPLLVKLLGNEMFVHVASVHVQDSEDSDYSLASCVLLLTICQLVSGEGSDVKGQWLNLNTSHNTLPCMSLLDNVFSAVSDCYTELHLPVYLDSSTKKKSLYEYILTQVCVFIASYPKEHFNQVENCLLNNVLQPESFTAIMAVDTWCFIARYGSAELCKNHCVFLTELLLSQDLTFTPECCHLVILLRRTLKFLATEHQEEYLSKFPVKDHVLLWSVIPIHTFCEQKCNVLVEDIIDISLCCMKSIRTSEVVTAQDYLQLHYALQALMNVMNNPFTVDTEPVQTNLPALLSTTFKLLTATCKETVQRFKLLQVCVSSLLELYAVFTSLTTVDNSQLLTVLQYIYWFTRETNKLADSQHEKDPCNDLKLSAMCLVQNIGKKALPPSNEQCHILQLLPKLFISWLSDTNVIVQHKAMEMFGQFAEETPHESIVPESLSSNEVIQNQVVEYLNKVSSGNVPPPPSRDQLKFQKLLQRNYSERDVTKLYIPQDFSQPNEDDSVNAALEKTVIRLKENIGHLSEISRNASLPGNIKEELKICYEELGKLIY